MGGAAHVGNATASAEFNVFHDPEAAAITLDACADLGIEVVMYGLDVFYGPRVALERGPRPGRRCTTDGPAGLAGRLIAFQCERFGADSATIGDAGAVCAVLDPDGLTTERLPVRVELAGTWSRGRTIVDRRDWDGNLAHDPHGQAPASHRRRPRRGRRALRPAVAGHGHRDLADGTRAGARVAQRRPGHPRRAASRSPARPCSARGSSGSPAARAPTRRWRPRRPAPTCVMVGAVGRRRRGSRVRRPAARARDRHRRGSSYSPTSRPARP